MPAPAKPPAGGKTEQNKDAAPVKKKKTAVKTYCRIRPRFEGWEDKVTMKIADNKVTNSAKRTSSKLAVRTTRFFNKVYGPEAKNKKLFDSMVVPMLENVMNGFSSVLIAYGQTGSGKTFTMMGIGNDSQLGLLPYSLQWLLERAEPGSLELSAVEVYGIHPTKVEFYDLFEQPEDWSDKKPLRALTEARSIKPETKKQCLDFVLKAHKGSHFAPTAKNPQSSRGHVAFVARVTSNGRQSAFVIVDLAGSEGMDALQSSEMKMHEHSYETRKMEAGVIKNGLGELRGMINELKRRKLQKAKGSGLRQLLFEHVTGNTILSFIFTIAPSQMHSIATENTLRVADSASQIKKQVARLKQQGPSAKQMMSGLQKENEDLNELLKKSRLETAESISQTRALEDEIADLREQLGEVDKLKRELKIARGRNSYKERRIHQLEEQVREHRRSNADLNAQLMATMELANTPTPGGPPNSARSQSAGSIPKTDLQTENDRLREEITHLCQKIVKLNGEIEGQKTEMDVVRRRHRELKRKGKLDVARVENELEATKMRLKELERTLNVRNEELKRLAEQLEESQQMTRAQAEADAARESTSKDDLEEDEDEEANIVEEVVEDTGAEDTASEAAFPTISLERCQSITATAKAAMQENETQMEDFLKASWEHLCKSGDGHREATRQLFEKIDTDGDGVIDLCEFTAAVTKFLSDQESINRVFNKVCTRTIQHQKVMELPDLENLVFVEANKYSDQPLELIFEKAVLAKLHQPMLNFEDDVIGDWMDWKSSNDSRWFGADWQTVWVECDRRKQELRVWNDNLKRELPIREIDLSQEDKCKVYYGSRDSAKKGVMLPEDNNKFYIVVSAKWLYDSVYNFRLSSTAIRSEWAKYILQTIKGLDGISATEVQAKVTLVLGHIKNTASARTFKFDRPNPLVSEVAMKLRKMVNADRDLRTKFGLPRSLEGVQLLCEGKALNSIDTLKDGDVVYAVRKETKSPRKPPLNPRPQSARAVAADALSQDPAPPAPLDKPSLGNRGSSSRTSKTRSRLAGEGDTLVRRRSSRDDRLSAAAAAKAAQEPAGGPESDPPNASLSSYVTPGGPPEEEPSSTKLMGLKARAVQSYRRNRDTVATKRRLWNRSKSGDDK